MANQQKDPEEKKQSTEEVAGDAGRDAERRPIHVGIAGDREEARDAQARNEEKEMRERQPPASLKDDPANAREASNPEVAETRVIDAAILH